MTHSLRAVLWDMDGTLVDTEPYWMAAEVALVEAHGGTWTHEQAMGLVGNGLMESARILQGAGVDMPAEEIVQHLTAEVTAALKRDGAPFRPGAREMLKSLHADGIRTALVTMSLGVMARSVVEVMDFDAFELIVAGDDVENPKPHPEPYLQAAALLGVDIADTAVIEDSRTGLQSGIASGAVSIGVPHMIALDDMPADAIWSTLEGKSASDVVSLFRTVREGEVQ